MPAPHLPPARLTLLVPGLLWPRPALDDTVRGLRLPALERLLRLGAVARSGMGESLWWRTAFSLAAPLPAAALRRKSFGGEADDAEWVCLDPVSLNFGQQDAILGDPAGLALDAAEDAALLAELAPLFAGLGTLSSAAPGQWHLRPQVALPALPERLEAGASAHRLIPQGEVGKPWRRALSEAQMQLHAHPINRAREAAGRAVVNSLALWGAGRLPPRARSEFDLLLSAELPCRGLAALSGAAAAPPPDGFEALAGLCGAGTKNILLHLGDLAAATRQHDALGWRSALETLDRRWFAPALAAADGGRLAQVTLTGFGDDSGLSLRYAGRDRFRFWRRPLPLAELHP